MGNRAVVTKTPFDENNTGVYLHWNGDINSIAGFLAFCDLKGYRSVNEDETYAWAMLVNTITNFFADGLSCGVGPCSKLDCDNHDNGTYLIKGWRIVERVYDPAGYQEGVNVDAIKGIVEYINAKVPENMKVESGAIDTYFSDFNAESLIEKVVIDKQIEDNSWIDVNAKVASLNTYELKDEDGNVCKGIFIPKNVLPKTLQELGYVTVFTDMYGDFIQSGYYRLDDGVRINHVVAYRPVQIAN